MQSTKGRDERGQAVGVTSDEEQRPVNREVKAATAPEPGWAGPGRVRVAFVGGHGRSGSTLLSRILDSVPGVTAVGELRYVWDQGVLRDRGCGCGCDFSSCEFWQAVGREAFGGWSRSTAERAVALRHLVERTRYIPLLTAPGLSATFSRNLSEYTDLMSTVFRAVAKVSGGDIVVDTSKYPSTAYLLRRVPGVELRLVHLVRSSHGVCWSWTKTVSRPDRDGKPLARYPYWRSALNWDVDNAAIDVLGAQGVPRVLVRYEDLVEEPGEQVRRVLDALGVSVGSTALDFTAGGSVTLSKDHSVAGNPNRFTTGTQVLRLDDEWQRRMHPSSRRAITVVTAPGLLRYGYLGRRASSRAAAR